VASLPNSVRYAAVGSSPVSMITRPVELRCEWISAARLDSAGLSGLPVIPRRHAAHAAIARFGHSKVTVDAKGCSTAGAVQVAGNLPAHS
jgi:hypothetical protein